MTLGDRNRGGADLEVQGHWLFLICWPSFRAFLHSIGLGPPLCVYVCGAEGGGGGLSGPELVAGVLNCHYQAFAEPCTR